VPAGPSGADWPDWTQDEGYLAALADEEDPGDLDLYQDPIAPRRPGWTRTSWPR
jgi:hypothetical protein